MPESSQPPSRPTDRGVLRHLRELFAIRKPAPRWQVMPLAVLCMAIVLGLWWLATRGESAEDRILRPGILPSPRETFSQFHSLWFDRALTRNAVASLKRVALGFGLAMAIGVPLGVLAGCFSRVQAFLLPLTIFGRNIPIAALIPLTFSFFGVGELQKVMFICIACVAFVLSDTADAIRDVSLRYVDTAYTLGAARRQVILKVLVPLAMPSIFNSLRLLFGLAFGYIMLAELVKFSNESGGLGDIILTSQRRGNKEHILLVLMIIPLIALAIDRAMYWVQRELFPHQYGGAGLLNHAFRWLMHRWEDCKGLFLRPAAATELTITQATSTQEQQS